MDHLSSEWQRKGGTLSDKTARKELGPTQDEIVEARVNLELERLKARIAALEEQKARLIDEELEKG